MKPGQPSDGHKYYLGCGALVALCFAASAAIILLLGFSN